MPYIGVSPQFGVRKKHTYTATAGQTSFSGAGSEGATLSYTDSNFVDVYQNGVKLGDADYTSTSGTAIVLAQGASADDLVEIIVFDAFSAADTVSKADGGTFDGNITMAGTLSAKGGAVFNEDSADVDFRVEGNGEANLLLVDAGEDNVKIGDNAGNYAKLSLRNEAAGAQERGLYVEVAPASGTSPSNGVRRVHTYTATASQTTFSGAGAEGTTLSYKDSNYVDVYQNGIKLGDADYTSTSGTSIVLAQGASVDDLVVVVVFDVFSVADTVSKADGGTFDGAVTFGGGVSGNIANVSGDMTIDVAGDLTLDADGADVKISDGGTHVGTLSNSSSDFVITSAVQDKDILFKGDDGGSGITALTLDMSDGGKALFNDGIDANTDLNVKTSSGVSTISATATGSANLVMGTNFSGSASQGMPNQVGFINMRQSFPIVFGTAETERMRILANGDIVFKKTTADDTIRGVGIFNQRINSTSETAAAGLFNRQNNDGTLLALRQQNIDEGSITVSGSTVSFNGGHLSRWSQLTNNTRDNTIVKGTVMTNLDQMAEWTTDGVTEDNEQLNCMAVSSVEGDANVAGVFVSWDDDDDVYTNDMNVAMTGDMVIRIAQGTTVARGDLLMSAGDGTAKPQGDDIVRSKTIAKVTSTNVSHTYDDGTYLVPCVLMAC